MPQLKRVTVRGFKSIRALEGFELRSLNVLIGANGAGKSNFVSVFRMLSELAQRHLQAYVREQDGPDALLFGTRKRSPQMDVEVDFGRVGYSVSLQPAAQKLVFAREETWFDGEEGRSTKDLGSGHEEARLRVQDDSFAAYVRPRMTEWRVFHFPDTGLASPMRQAQPTRDNLRLKPDGGNLAAVLRHLREQYPTELGRIVDAVRLVAPFFGDFVYRKEPAERIELEWFEAGDPDTVRSPRQLSDGTLRFVALATLLLQPIDLQPDTILIDEPELGLHPYAIGVLGALLRQASASRQLIVSTQSPDLVSEVSPEDVVVVGRADGASTFQRLEPGPLQEWLEDYSLGELWKTNVLGGRPTR